MKRFLRNKDVEERAEERILEYERAHGAIAKPPVPIERLIEKVFKLRILWEPISTEHQLSPLAGIQPRERLIVINEDHRELFTEKPGLLNFTYGHELGHWDLHIDQAELDHPTFEGFEDSSGAFRHHRTPSGAVEVLVSRLHRHGVPNDVIQEVVHEATRGTDDFFEGRQANRYAAALLMPRDLVLRTIDGIDLTTWPVLYRLAERFEVTVTALRIRLEGLGLLHVAADGTIHRSKAEHLGQQQLGL